MKKVKVVLLFVVAIYAAILFIVNINKLIKKIKSCNIQKDEVLGI
jgi:hypothetical protein